MRHHDDDELQDCNQVDDAVARAKLLLRLAEPVGEHTIFGDAHEQRRSTRRSQC